MFMCNKESVCDAAILGRLQDLLSVSEIMTAASTFSKEAVFFLSQMGSTILISQEELSGTSHVNLLDGQSSCEFVGRSLVVLPIKIDNLAL